MGKIRLAVATLMLGFCAIGCSTTAVVLETPLEKVVRIAMASPSMKARSCPIQAAWCGIWLQTPETLAEHLGRSKALMSDPLLQAADGSTVLIVRDAESGGAVQIRFVSIDSGVPYNVYLDLAP